MKSNNGILTEKEIQARTKFWNKEQFRTWTKREMNRDAANMQKVLVAIKDLTVEEIYAERKACRSFLFDLSAKDIEYAISIAPKTFKCKKC